MSILCSMVGASFGTITVAAEVLRRKTSVIATGVNVATAQSKFGGSSAFFDGTSTDILAHRGMASNPTGDMTLEGWIYLSALPPTGDSGYMMFHTGSGDNYVSLSSTNKIQLAVGGRYGTVTLPSIYAINTWYHLAIVRSSGTYKVYWNGTDCGAFANDLNWPPPAPTFDWPATDAHFGRFTDSRGDWSGYMDELRISKVARYTANFIPATQPFVNDDNTLLLIHANGTDASTFFEDDNGTTTARTARIITAVGNAQISTAQSQFGGASLLVDGTGDYLQTGASTAFTYGTSDFTVEFWIRSASMTGVEYILWDQRTATTSDQVCIAYGNAGGGSSVLYLYIAGAVRITGSALSANTWHHIAVSRTGTSTRMFANGTQIGSTWTDTTNYANNTSYGAIIGVNATTGTAGFNGYYDELRVSNSARYTANFTPSTQPFANDSNTQLLIHANGPNASTYFEDDCGGRRTKGIAAINGAAISTTQSKFGGSSVFFDGTNDYLAPSFIDFVDTITGNFTFETWFYSTGSGTSGDGIFSNDNGSTGANKFLVYFEPGNTRIVWFLGSGTAINSNTTMNVNTWYHIAFVRNGSTTTLYVNGVAQSATSSYTAELGFSSLWKIGVTAGSYFQGYLDEIRWSNTARYTANFTAPTTPFVNDVNTVLLIHADGTNGSTVFRDDNGIIGSTPKVLSPQGNTQISTAQYKFGASSAYFDGTGDYLRLGQPGNFNFGSDNWTIEGFIRPTNNLSGYKVVYNHNDNGTDRSWITIQLENSTLKSWGTSSTSSWSIYSDLSFGTLTVDTWHHFALVRDGDTMRAFLNGTQINTASCTGWTLPAQTAAATLSAVPASYFYGWMDGIRISNTARYGASGYTTPTSAFTQDSNTLMLLNFEGANASTTFIDSAGRTQKGVSAVGNAQVSTAQSKFGGASSLYDGNGDYLQLANSNDFNFGSGNWTAEFWWYQPSNVAAGIYPTIICFGALSSDTGFLISSEPTTNKVNLISSANGSSGMTVNATSGNISAATWNHIAVVVNSSVATIYVNGTASGTGYGAVPKSSTGQMYIGGGLGGLSSGTLSSTSATVVNLNGYLDEIRISNIARYTAAFTPSTTPFQNDDNTLLLLHMDGTNASTVFFDDNGAKPYTP